MPYTAAAARGHPRVTGDLRTHNAMNQLTLDIIKIVFLTVLWLFVISAVGVVRTDLFDQPASPRRQRRAAGQAARRPQPAAPPRPA